MALCDRFPKPHDVGLRITIDMTVDLLVFARRHRFKRAFHSNNRNACWNNPSIIFNIYFLLQ